MGSFTRSPTCSSQSDWRFSGGPHGAPTCAGGASCYSARYTIGFGLFNLVEGLVNHQLLGIHHVNETVPREQWIYWDLGFLIWGAAMLAAGWLLLRSGQEETGSPR